MIVADASAVVELLLQSSRYEALADLLLADEPVVAPHLVDVEVAQVLRRWQRQGTLAESRARQAFDDLVALPILRQPHDLLLDRVWELRQNLTAYDAVYLALAELLEARLVTLDRGLARIASKTVEVIVPQ